MVVVAAHESLADASPPADSDSRALVSPIEVALRSAVSAPEQPLPREVAVAALSALASEQPRVAEAPATRSARRSRRRQPVAPAYDFAAQEPTSDEASADAGPAEPAMAQPPVPVPGQPPLLELIPEVLPTPPALSPSVVPALGPMQVEPVLLREPDAPRHDGADRDPIRAAWPLLVAPVGRTCRSSLSKLSPTAVGVRLATRRYHPCSAAELRSAAATVA